MRTSADSPPATVAYVDQEGVAQRCLGDAINDIAFEMGHPIRGFPAHRRQRHMPGFYWCATSRRHVPYESRLEMAVLVRLDFDLEVVSVSAQPFRLEYGEDQKRRHHVPDFFVVLRSGRRRVVDVKPADMVGGHSNQVVLALTKEMCDSAGWEYAVATEPEPTLLANLSWLAGYRCRPPDPFGFAPLLLERCGDPITFVELVRAVRPAAVVRPVLVHSLWSQALTFDLASPLDGGTVLRRASEHRRAARWPPTDDRRRGRRGRRLSA